MNVALRPDSFNLISLCTGGGGLDLGVELAVPSARSVVLVEREAFSASQLVSSIQQGLVAEAAIWSDVTTFNGRPWRGIVDGVIGGIPCQPHSLAGKRQGRDDERDLWSDARRIIVQSGAWFVLIENVSGMLSAKPGLDPGALRVRRDLQRLGFDVEGGLFTASEVGASHERERVFILAVADRNHEHDYRAWVERAGRRGQSSNSGSQLADASRNDERRERRPGEGNGGIEAGGYGGLRGGSPLVNATGNGRRERRPEPVLRSRRDAASSADHSMGDAIGSRHYGRPDDALGRSIGRTLIEGSGERLDGSVAHANVLELRRQSSARQQPFLQSDDGSGQAHLFPPGPSDLRSWAGILASAPELEPAFRRVANGLASRLDVARVDRLRMLGNGVVPLEAAYAVRTLATRLAASGSAGAARLVRILMPVTSPLTSPDLWSEQ